MDPVQQIVKTVLYEGYLLWPYRRSSKKNQRRWTFGGVYPRSFSASGGGDDPWLMQTQILVQGEAPIIDVTVQFLHVVERQVARRDEDGALEFVDELTVADERYLTWDEAAERDIVISGLNIAELEKPKIVEIAVPAGRDQELLATADGATVGAVIRSWRELRGAAELSAEHVQEQLFKLTVKITNTTPWDHQDRESTLRQTFVSTHTILRADASEFVSMTDPPSELAPIVEACNNVKTWPVLVGDKGDKSMVLSSPIILYDYPEIAPESPGDLFDGTEIDQLLMLNILTLTDAEKAEMRASDPRAREILERTEAFDAQDFMNLHGTFRDFRMLGEEHAPTALFEELEQPAPTSILVDGVEITKGSKVRLHPHAGGDIFDIALDGKVAYIEAIDQDYEERIHLSVTIEDDPGRALGAERILGHRFFFSPDEIEPLEGVGESEA